MNRIALDLELNVDGVNPTESIIQIGYCMFNTETSEILYTGGDYVQIEKPLYPYITKLTSITQYDIDTRGVSFQQAYLNLVAKCEEYGVWKQLVTWGSGDLDALKQEFNMLQPDSLTPWVFGRTEFNTKALFQAARMQQNLSWKGGLKKSMGKIGIPWQVYNDQITPDHIRQRSAHDARADALNTALTYMKLMSYYK